MKKRMRGLTRALCNRLFLIIFVVVLFVIVASANKKSSVTIYNINRTKSIEAIHIVTKYNNILDKERPRFVETIQEVSQYGADGPLHFTGTMTGYGPDCVGCSGKLGCPPRQDARNGNIYFDDVDYGRVRIVATDPSIPCGSIVKISNLNFTDETIVAIALDRGGAIKGKTMDLLFESEKATSFVGRQYQVSFELVRWGW